MCPTANNHYATIVIGKKPRRIVSTEGKDYRAAVKAIVRKDNVPKCNGSLHVEGFLFFPTRAGDTDNRIKPTLDALEKAHVFDNDSQVGRVDFRRAGSRAAKPGFMIIRISAFAQEEIMMLQCETIESITVEHFVQALETGEL